MQLRVTADRGNAPGLPIPGDMIDGFRVLRTLGQGGLSRVYLAAHDDGRCALKLLWPHLSAVPAARKMLLDEADIVTRIRHPNIASLMGRGEWHGLPYLALEWVDGRTLAAVLRELQRSGRVLPVGFFLAVLGRVALGLDAAHRAIDADGRPAAVIHRDVKPQNILIGHDGVVKVIDFSNASARRRSTRTQAGTVKGTLNYLAPEQITSSNHIDHRVDVWGVGVLAWEALAGRQLFRGRALSDAVLNIVYAEIPSLTELAPDVPRQVVDCVMQCLRRTPQQRPQTCAEVARVLMESAAALGWASPTKIADQLGRIFECSQTVHIDALADEEVVEAPPLLDAPSSAPGATPYTADELTSAPSLRTPAPPAVSRPRAGELSQSLLIPVVWAEHTEPALRPAAACRQALDADATLPPQKRRASPSLGHRLLRAGLWSAALGVLLGAALALGHRYRSGWSPAAGEKANASSSLAAPLSWCAQTKSDR